MEKLTYDTLRNAFRLQRENKSKLITLEDGFYQNIKSYLSELESDIKNTEKNSSNRFTDKIYENKKKEIQNAYSTLKDLILLRFRIISEIAAEDALNFPAIKDGMTKEEKRLFSKLTVLFTEEKNSVFQDENLEIEEQEFPKETVKKPSENVKVRVKNTVPTFLGTDRNSYGPYEKGDIVEIPSKNAEMLENKGMVEII